MHLFALNSKLASIFTTSVGYRIQWSRLCISSLLCYLFYPCPKYLQVFQAFLSAIGRRGKDRSLSLSFSLFLSLILSFSLSFSLSLFLSLESISPLFPSFSLKLSSLAGPSLPPLSLSIYIHTYIREHIHTCINGQGFSPFTQPRVTPNSQSLVKSRNFKKSSLQLCTDFIFPPFSIHVLPSHLQFLPTSEKKKRVATCRLSLHHGFTHKLKLLIWSSDERYPMLGSSSRSICQFP